jgi:hypothetical protein
MLSVSGTADCVIAEESAAGLLLLDLAVECKYNRQQKGARLEIQPAFLWIAQVASTNGEGLQIKNRISLV